MCKSGRANDDGFDLGQVPLVAVLEIVVEELGHDKTEHRVTEKFKALVRWVFLGLDGGMGQCLSKESWIFEAVSNVPLALP